ncbi:Hypothetical_protein [Hexamita inflata]|uniref:Hypothetical_protein n=1 Tax=Hexamita inflata TaxID=28002 RepID=A0AA86QHJ8_9EUKA|nr:Hypothetical protein HINF_LOCUS46063 [Hexamita inflata]
MKNLLKTRERAVTKTKISSAELTKQSMKNQDLDHKNEQNDNNLLSLKFSSQQITLSILQYYYDIMIVQYKIVQQRKKLKKFSFLTKSVLCQCCYINILFSNRYHSCNDNNIYLNKLSQNKGRILSPEEVQAAQRNRVALENNNMTQYRSAECSAAFIFIVLLMVLYRQRAASGQGHQRELHRPVLSQTSRTAETRSVTRTSKICKKSIYSARIRQAENARVRLVHQQFSP